MSTHEGMDQHTHSQSISVCDEYFCSVRAQNPIQVPNHKHVIHSAMQVYSQMVNAQTVTNFYLSV